MSARSRQRGSIPGDGGRRSRRGGKHAASAASEELTERGGEPSSSQPLLAVEDLSVEFGTEDGRVRAVRGVSFELAAGEVLGVVGESGCGKSVTAAAVMGLLPRNAAVHGSIRFAGKELLGAAPARLRALRGNEISMIFQDPMTSLNPVYTVGWQLAEAYRAHHRVSRREARSKAVEALDRVGIPRPERRVEAYPHEFSGGMRQRVVIAMAVINDPRLIIADEPTTALDVTVQAQILEMLERITSASGTAILLITHDLGVVAGMADRVQVMYGGTVVESAPAGELFARPRMPYTVGLLGSVPHPELVGQRLTPIPGAPPSPLRLPAGCAFAPRCPWALADPCLATEPELARVGRAKDRHLARCHRSAELATELAGKRAEGPAGKRTGQRAGKRAPEPAGRRTEEPEPAGRRTEEPGPAGRRTEERAEQPAAGAGGVRAATPAGRSAPHSGGARTGSGESSAGTRSGESSGGTGSDGRRARRATRSGRGTPGTLATDRTEER